MTGTIPLVDENAVDGVAEAEAESVVVVPGNGLPLSGIRAIPAYFFSFFSSFLFSLYVRSSERPKGASA
jgi:hypothetical protein